MSEVFELTLTRNIPAPRVEVFDAWLTVEGLKQFMMPGEGMTVPRAEVDAQVGGKYLIVMKAGEQEIPHRGEYKLIDRYNELKFTWMSEFSVQDSTVTLTFKELSKSETELTLHHVGFPSKESCDNHTQGWNTILGVLVKLFS
ncbi:SRPBCC domain-containing protein [bacterium]|nr:SRPBCC domain-containing protein [bacterium]